MNLYAKMKTAQFQQHERDVWKLCVTNVRVKLISAFLFREISR